MNLFASLEDILAPAGEPKAPQVGIMVQDWDENLMQAAGQIVDLGYNVTVWPQHAIVSVEAQDASNNGIVPESQVTPGHTPQTLYYYKGKPENVAEHLPVLVVEEGKVKVSTEDGLVDLEEHFKTVRDDGGQEFR
jgi:hypothetical protein